MTGPAGVAVTNEPMRRSLPGFCRDCRGDAQDGVSRCPACGSPRLLRHPELDALAHRPCRLRRVLRHDREARRSRARRQTGDRRRRPARRGAHRLLCGAHLWRALGDADVRGTAAVPARQRGAARHGEIRPRRPRGARAHVRAHAAGRAGLDRRGVHGSGRDRAPARHVARQGARALRRRRRDAASASRCRSASPPTSSSPRSPPIWTSRAALPCSAQAEAAAFLAPKPVTLIFGVGKVAQQRLARDGLRTDRRSAARRRARADAPLRHRRRTARAPGARHRRSRRSTPTARPRAFRRKPPSSRTSPTSDALEQRLWRLCEKVSARLKSNALAGCTVTLKLKTADFRIRTRARALGAPDAARRHASSPPGAICSGAKSTARSSA